MIAKPSFKNVLVPADGSDSSVMAEQTAVNIAKKTGASVTIFHMLQDLKIEELPRNLHDEILDGIEQHANQIETDALALFGKEKIKTAIKRTRGVDAAEAILNLSEKNCDLVVMGAGGENMTDPYVLGSVTKKVIRHSKCPTLITKKVTPLSSLLVCTDGSRNSVEALNYAVQLSEEGGSKLTLLNVVERRIYDLSPETAKKVGQNVLSRTIKAVVKEKLKLDQMVRYGPTSDTIAKVAKEGGYDLIVIGSRGLGSVGRFLMGSVSDNVSHEAKCSVLVVPMKT